MPKIETEHVILNNNDTLNYGLSSYELENIGQILGENFSIVASGISRLYVTNPSPKASKRDPKSAYNVFPGIRKGRWMQTNCEGALVLALERNSQALYFMFFNVFDFSRLLEYELYYGLEYKELTEQFHAFEMEDMVAGFNFAHKAIAKAFLIKVKMVIPDAKKNKIKLIQGPSANGKRGSKIRARTLKRKQKNNEVVMNLENLPPNWRILLKEAGFKKKDLKDPGMAALIRACLEDVGISTTAPPLDLSPKQLKEIYSAEDVARIEQYQREMEEYERKMQKYEEDLQAYEEFQRQMNGLELWEEEVLETQKLEEYTNEIEKSKKKVPPPLPPRKKVPTKPPAAEEVIPETPKPPLLPIVADNNNNENDENEDESKRKSKRKSFLKEMLAVKLRSPSLSKKNDKNHLPNIENLEKDKHNDLLFKLKQKLIERRAHLSMNDIENETQLDEEQDDEFNL